MGIEEGIMEYCPRGAFLRSGCNQVVKSGGTPKTVDDSSSGE